MSSSENCGNDIKQMEARYQELIASIGRHRDSIQKLIEGYDIEYWEYVDPATFDKHAGYHSFAMIEMDRNELTELVKQMKSLGSTEFKIPDNIQEMKINELQMKARCNFLLKGIKESQDYISHRLECCASGSDPYKSDFTTHQWNLKLYKTELIDLFKHMESIGATNILKISNEIQDLYNIDDVQSKELATLDEDTEKVFLEREIETRKKAEKQELKKKRRLFEKNPQIIFDLQENDIPVLFSNNARQSYLGTPSHKKLCTFILAGEYLQLFQKSEKKARVKILNPLIYAVLKSDPPMR